MLNISSQFMNSCSSSSLLDMRGSWKVFCRIFSVTEFFKASELRKYFSLSGWVWFLKKQQQLSTTFSCSYFLSLFLFFHEVKMFFLFLLWTLFSWITKLSLQTNQFPIFDPWWSQFLEIPHFCHHLIIHNLNSLYFIRKIFSRILFSL